jgi:hypothetical protein
VDGYGNRFGLIYVDFDTLERTPKLSGVVPRGGEAERRGLNGLRFGGHGSVTSKKMT